ncbi:hypothetical protein BGX24_005575 [Mortierella sp. AD032]|nr:hypothetical protein BGX24_005575 [Mortierella sp. AD032]
MNFGTSAKISLHWSPVAQAFQFNTLFWIQSSGSGLKDSSTNFEFMEFPGSTDKESIKTYISRALDVRLPLEAVDMLFEKFAGRFRPAAVAMEKIVERNEQGAWKVAIEDTEDRLKAVRQRMISSTPSDQGCVFEQFMMKVFSETFNNKPLSDWPHQPPISDMCTALVGKVDIVAWREPGLDQGTTHRQMTMTDFIDAHVNHQSIRNNKLTAYFSSPSPSHQDQTYFSSFGLTVLDWVDALSTVSAPKIESHANDFRRYCPDNVYVSMVVAYSTRWTEWTSNLPSLSDLPRDASGV